MLLKGLSILIVAAASSSGVSESDFYPIIEYWRAGDFRPNQLCGTSATAATVESYPSRPSAGLLKWAHTLIDTYNKQAKNLSTKDLSYSARQRRKTSDWDTLVASSLKGAIANARSGQDASLGKLFCANTMQSVTPEQFCYAMGNFSRSTQCLTDYTYRDSSRVAQQLQGSNDFGWTLPQECLQPISANRPPLNLGIQRFSYTPDEIDRNVVSAESKVYYLMWKAIDHLNRFAESEYLLALQQIQGDSSDTRVAPKVVKRNSVGIHDLFRNERVFAQILPEWEVKKVVMINEARFLGGPTLRTPFGVIAQRGADVLVVFRRSVTTFDARLALYNQQSLKFLYNFTGEVHDGSSTIFQTLSGVLEFSFDSIYEAMDLSKVVGPVTVTFAAADLPASGGAVILASHMQKVLAEKFGGAENVQVNAIVFGTDLISDKTFVDKVRRTLEVRSIQVQGDSTDLFPCPRTYSCDERVLLPRTGIETGKEYSYAALPGKITITLDDLSRFDSVWGQESSVLQLAALKDCAYACFLAKTTCPSDPDHRCDKNTCPSLV